MRLIPILALLITSAAHADPAWHFTFSIDPFTYNGVTYSADKFAVTVQALGLEDFGTAYPYFYREAGNPTYDDMAVAQVVDHKGDFPKPFSVVLMGFGDGSEADGTIAEVITPMMFENGKSRGRFTVMVAEGCSPTGFYQCTSYVPVRVRGTASFSVPEPGTLGLLLAAIPAGFLLARRRPAVR